MELGNKNKYNARELACRCSAKVLHTELFLLGVGMYIVHLNCSFSICFGFLSVTPVVI